MTFIVILLCIGIIIFLHKKVVSKNQKTWAKVLITIANIFWSLVFIILFASVTYFKNEANDFIDRQIASLEETVNEIYPNLLNKQMSTVEIKDLLAKAQKTNSSQGVGAYVENFAKSQVSDYTSQAYDFIQNIESSEGKLSLKDGIVYLKGKILDAVMPKFTMLQIGFFVMYLIGLAILVVVSLVLSKFSKKSEGIIYGEGVDDVKIGLK